MKREKFNGVELFAQEGDGGANAESLKFQGLNLAHTASIAGEYVYTDDPVANNRTKESSTKFGFQLYTHPSGEADDGSISLNVINLQALLAIKDASGFTGLNGPTNGEVSVANTINLGGLYFQPENKGSYTPNGTASLEFTTDWSTTNERNLDQAKTADEITDDNYIKDITKISIDEFTNVIEKIADIRAENGAEQQRLSQSLRLQQNNLVNMEAAHGRIMDVDVALESTRLARHSVKVQASAAMVAQANQMTAVALTLLSN